MCDTVGIDTRAGMVAPPYDLLRGHVRPRIKLRPDHSKWRPLVGGSVRCKVRKRSGSMGSIAEIWPKPEPAKRMLPQQFRTVMEPQQHCHDQMDDPTRTVRIVPPLPPGTSGGEHPAGLQSGKIYRTWVSNGDGQTGQANWGRLMPTSLLQVQSRRGDVLEKARLCRP